MQFDSVLFDLDGTLTESGEGIKKSAAYAIEKMGFPPRSFLELDAFVGPPLIASFMAECGMTEAQALQATQFYRERFEKVGWKENKVYPGIPVLLKALKKAGCSIAIATGKPELFAIRIAEFFGLSPFLDKIVGITMDDNRADKSHLIERALPEGADRSRAVMIGDRKFDIDAAHATGVSSIGVTYGYGSREELDKTRPDAIAENVDALFALLGVARPRGHFITFEGADGCGKSTQINLVNEWLTLRGYETILSREPGGCPISERIRQVVLDIRAEGMTDECEALLFAASRAQHVNDVILPALVDGKIMLCDRFLDSSLAYQAHGRELGEAFIRQINKPALKVQPDLTLLFMADVHKAKSRVRASSEPDRIEVEASAYFVRVNRAYSDMLQTEPDRIRLVDSNGPIEEVSQHVLPIVEDFLTKE